MIGSNKMLLNEATLIEAMQEYITTRTSGGAKNAPKVTAVKYEAHTSAFMVHIEGPTQ